MRLALVLLVCGLVLGTSNSGFADTEIKPGMKFQTFIRPGHLPQQVALPEGEWEVAAVVQDSTHRSQIPTMTVILFQYSRNKLSKTIWFSTNIEGQTNGYTQESNCSRNDLHYRETVSNSNGGDQDCRWLNHYRLTLIGSKNKSNRDAGAWLQKKNIEIPNHLILSGYRFADVLRYLTVWYFFNPEIDGFDAYPRTTWQDSPWHPTNVASDQKKLAYINHLKGWTNKFYPTVKAGFNGKLTGVAIQKPATAIPPATGSPSVASDIAERLKKLDALLKQELITKQEYEQRRKEILNSL